MIEAGRIEQRELIYYTYENRQLLVHLGLDHAWNTCSRSPDSCLRPAAPIRLDLRRLPGRLRAMDCCGGGRLTLRLR